MTVGESIVEKETNRKQTTFFFAGAEITLLLTGILISKLVVEILDYTDHGKVSK